MQNKNDGAQLQELIRKSYIESRILELMGGSGVQQLLNLLTYLENAVLLARRMESESVQRLPGRENSQAPVWPKTTIAGAIETTEFGWLHITLHTLLPHCRFKTPAYLSDTITRLLDSHRTQGGYIPFFKKAMIIIDEHCNIENRQVFDQDNKGWKAIPNALKGVVIEDDDQQSMELALLSTEDSNAACHIYVLNADEAGEFFSIRSGQYGFLL